MLIESVANVFMANGFTFQTCRTTPTSFPADPCCTIFWISPPVQEARKPEALKGSVARFYKVGHDDPNSNLNYTIDSGWKKLIKVH